MRNLTTFVLAHRKLVVVLTAFAFLLGGGATAFVVTNAAEEFTAPGLPGYDANKRITDTFGTGGRERPFVPVVTLPDGLTVDSPGVPDALDRALTAVEEETGSRVAGYPDTGDRRFVGDDGRVTFALVFGNPVEQGGLPGSALGEGVELDQAITDAMRPHLPAGAKLQVTGLDQLATGEDAGGLNVGVKLGITVCAAALVLAWAFRSRLAAVPLLIAAVAVPVSFLALAVLSLFVEIHETSMMMAPLFGIGIAVDYALIVVSRWREERGHGDGAVHRAMATAGHAVLFSGAAVAIGLLSMIVLPIPFLRSLGLAGTAVTAASVAVTLTLLPVVLARAGERLDRAGRTDDDRSGRWWMAVGEWVVRRRVPVAVGTGALLLGLASIGLGLDAGIPTTKNLDHSGEGHDGLVTLQDAGVPDGVLASFDVYVPPERDADALTHDLGELPGVHGVVTAADVAWRQDGAAVLTVIPHDEAGTPAGQATIERVIDVAGEGHVGGYATQQLDFSEATYSAFGWMIALLSLVTFIVLVVQFRSVLLPLKAVLLNLLSLGAVFGCMVVVWQWGWGTEAVLGVQPDGVVGTFLPVTVFAFLYGLSMDYEVFLLARMREEYDRTGDTRQAVARGLGRTGRLVTCAALILFCSFASMATSGELDVTMFASSIAFGILLDATLIRMLLVPATVALLGKWNWYSPRDLFHAVTRRNALGAAPARR